MRVNPTRMPFFTHAEDPDARYPSPMAMLVPSSSSQIPTEFGLLTALTELTLLTNKLTGPVPSQLGLTALSETLGLSFNSLGV